MKRLLLSGVLAVTAHAVDVSGTYENVGTVVGERPAALAEPVNFRGLLTLEFDRPLANARFADVTRIVLTQTDSAFKVSCRDADGNEVWTGRWQRDLGYDFDAKQVKLLFSSKEKKDDGYLFQLSPAGDGNVLIVEITEIHAGPFGPTGKPAGLFAFERAPKKARQ